MACGVTALAVTVTLMQPIAPSAKEQRTNRNDPRYEAAILHLLYADQTHWPKPLAREFVKRVPRRFLPTLAGQTLKTIPYYVAQEKLLKVGTLNDVFCWGSIGSGGGYAAVFRRISSGYELMWDSLVPPAMIAPRIQYADVDCDSLLEIICQGERIDGTGREWFILRWDGANATVLAPRLDQPARDLWYNRLIGTRLVFADSDSSAAKTLILTLPAESPSDTIAVTRRFNYDAEVDGFLPPP
jgi:hypothetical protein